MKKVMFFFMPILALFLASCGGGSSNTVEDLVLPVMVDYSQSIEQALEAGRYDWINENISSTSFLNDKRDTSVLLEATLITFNRSMTSEDVVAQLRLRGFRPGTAQELYALGARYPRLQREITIIALGSKSADSRVPALCGHVDGRRGADLWSWSVDWRSGDWFLAFRD